MRKYYSISALILTLAIGVPSVQAKTIQTADKIEEVKVVDTFKVEKTNIVYGSEEQLKKVNQEVMQFVKSIANEAYVIGNKYGIYPSVTIAQAVLESNIGKSGLAQAPNNNLFGVKGAYKGSSVTLSTLEDAGSGNMFTITTPFKKYPNKLASLEDHGKLLREGLNGLYFGTWRENAKTPGDATAFLQGRYATDTKYASKLNQIIKNYNLTRFDSELTDADFEWLKSDSLDPWEKEVTVVEDLPRVNNFENTTISIIKPVKLMKETLGSGNQNKDYMKRKLETNKEISSLPRTSEFAVGYGVVYIYQDFEKLEERYAVVEVIEEDYIVISEASVSELGLQIELKTILTEDLYKYTFISNQIN